MNDKNLERFKKMIKQWIEEGRYKIGSKIDLRKVPKDKRRDIATILINNKLIPTLHGIPITRENLPTEITKDEKTIHKYGVFSKKGVARKKK